MAHDLDTSNGQYNIAYRGEAPWHREGQVILPGDSVMDCAKKAGLTHEVLKANVEYRSEAPCTHECDDKFVLYRSDTHKPLGIVGSGYKIVQPSVIIKFFETICKHNGFELETMGSLGGGKKIWAMAKINNGAPIVDRDIVKPYLALWTSYDGTMATTGKFLSTRVVCANTMAIAENEKTFSIKVNHNNVFDPEKARVDLSIGLTYWDQFLIKTRKMAEYKLDQDEVEWITQGLVGGREDTVEKTRQTKAYKKIMELFKSGMGTNIPGVKGTSWGLLNAATEYVDHHRGHKGTRFGSALIGEGSALKAAAFDTLRQFVHEVESV